LDVKHFFSFISIRRRKKKSASVFGLSNDFFFVLLSFIQGDLCICGMVFWLQNAALADSEFCVYTLIYIIPPQTSFGEKGSSIAVPL